MRAAQGAHVRDGGRWHRGSVGGGAEVARARWRGRDSVGETAQGGDGQGETRWEAHSEMV